MVGQTGQEFIVRCRELTCLCGQKEFRGAGVEMPVNGAHGCKASKAGQPILLTCNPLSKRAMAVIRYHMHLGPAAGLKHAPQAQPEFHMPADR